MICSSDDYRVQVTLGSEGFIIPMNRDYRFVVPSTLALDDLNARFEENKKKYYDEILKDVGRYSSIDYKHYDDPRCKCILCWIHRTNFRDALNIPTVKAKLLFIQDQLLQDAHRQMEFDKFEKMLTDNVEGIQADMIKSLWESQNVDIFDLDSKIEDILSGSNLDSPTTLQTLQDGLESLQERIDKEYNNERIYREICDMSKSELDRKHVNILRDALRVVSKNFEDQPVGLWKLMFFHDFLKDNLSRNRVKDIEYKIFNGLSGPGKLLVLKKKISDFDLEMAKKKVGLYLLDPNYIEEAEKAYGDFQNEFQVFLTGIERENFDSLNLAVNNDMTIKFNIRKRSYMLEFLKQKGQELLEESQPQWKKDSLAPWLRLVENEQSIHKYGMQTKITSKIDCKQVVRDYAKKMWKNLLVLEDTRQSNVRKLFESLYSQKKNEYIEDYVNYKMKDFYTYLESELKKQVDENLWVNKLQELIEFYNKNGIQGNYNDNKKFFNTTYDHVKFLEDELDRYEKENYFKRSYPYPLSLWKIVDWFNRARKQNKLLKDLTYGVSYSVQQEQMDKMEKIYQDEAETNMNISDKIYIDLCLTFDLFGKWEVDENEMDNFIFKNLPPKESQMFGSEIRTLKKMVSELQQDAIKERIKYIRQVFKKIVFDKLITKNAILLRLREEKGLDVNDPEWIVWKHDNRKKWLDNNTKVFVLCNYPDIVATNPEIMATKNIRVKTGITEDMTTEDPRFARYAGLYNEYMNNRPKDWSANGRMVELQQAWIQKITDDNVHVRLDKRLNVEKNLKTVILEEFTTSINYVYDTSREYKIFVERMEQKNKELLYAKQKEKERFEERIRLIESIVSKDQIEAKKEKDAMEAEAESHARMFDEDRKEERYKLFQDWLKRIKNHGTDKSEIGEIRKMLEESQKNGMLDVEFYMFKDGFDQTGIAKKEARYTVKNVEESQKRSEEEQRDFVLAQKVMDVFERNHTRGRSNKYTYKYRKFMYYLHQGEDSLIRLMIQKEMEENNELDPNEFLREYKEELRRARERRENDYKKKYKRNPVLRKDIRLFKIIDNLIEDISRIEEDPRLRNENDPKIREYILSGQIRKDADIMLKTPYSNYTQEMLDLEVERSLKPLDISTYNNLVDYVKVRKNIEYLEGRTEVTMRETEYERDFKGKNTNGKPVYPTPDSKTLLALASEFKPPVVSKFAAYVRVGMGPGAWFKIDQNCDLMRQTGMSIEERLIFAVDVERMNNDQVSDREKSFILARKENWIDSDGDGSIRIMDDIVGDFTINDKGNFVKTSYENNTPTHLRLNCMYFDTVRGKSVRKLVPFYVVSLYTTVVGNYKQVYYKRLKVRNRADASFLPLQNKHKYIAPAKKNKIFVPYDIEDYKGYECSICLSKEEFDALTNGQQITGVARRITQIPDPFLFKYHKIIYKESIKRYETLLLSSKKNQFSKEVLKDFASSEILSVGRPDNMLAPTSDGLIVLGGTIRSMTSKGGIVNVDGRKFNVDGNLTDPVVDTLRVSNSDFMFGQTIQKFTRKIDLYSVHSNSMFASYGTEPAGEFRYRSVLRVWKLSGASFVSDWDVATSCSIIKWCGNILLAVNNSVVKGYDTRNRYTHTLTLKGHTSNILCMSVKNNQIVTGYKDGTLIVWKNKEQLLEKGKSVLVEIGALLEKGKPVLVEKGALRFEGFGKLLSIQDKTCKVSLYKRPEIKRDFLKKNCKTTAYVRTLYGHSGDIEHVEWGNSIVSSSKDNTIIVWDRDKVKFKLGLRSLRLVETSISIALVTPSILFYGSGNVLGKWNIITGKRIAFDNTIVNKVSQLPVKTETSSTRARIYNDFGNGRSIVERRNKLSYSVTEEDIEELRLGKRKAKKKRKQREKKRKQRDVIDRWRHLLIVLMSKEGLDFEWDDAMSDELDDDILDTMMSEDTDSEWDDAMSDKFDKDELDEDILDEDGFLQDNDVEIVDDVLSMETKLKDVL